MTLSEAVALGIARVRQPAWASPKAYLKLDLIAGGHGPWAHLYYRTTQAIIGAPTPQDILCALLGPDPDWEPYEGEIDPEDGVG